MPSIFDELVNWGGIDGYFVYDTKKKVFSSFHFPRDVDEKQSRQFLSTYIAKQEAVMDINVDICIFHGMNQVLGLSRNKGLILGIRFGAGSDIQIINDKIDELWTRFSVGI